MKNEDMLAFTYRIQKIIRDMRYTHMNDPELAARQAAVITQLEEVCRRIQQDFGEED